MMNAPGQTAASEYDLDALDIDAEKRKAIRTTDGPVLIIAGPGTLNRFAERRDG